MRMNQLNQVSTLSPSDLVLIWNGSQSRAAPFSVVTEAARKAVFDLINMPGGLTGIGAAASGANGDITALTGITTSRVTTDLNQTDATGWWMTTAATSNQPEAKPLLVWDQHGDGSHKAQIAVSLDSGKVYTRKQTVLAGAQVATWSNWIANLQAGDVTSDTIGATATGKALITASSAAAARTALGATTVGSNLFMSSDASGARTVLGMTATGSAVVTAASQLDAMSAIGISNFGRTVVQAADATALRVLTGMVATWRALTSTDTPSTDQQAAARTALGSTTVGDSLFTAATATAAQTAIGATTVGKAVIVAADQAAGRAAIGAMASDATPTTTARGGVLQQAAQADLTAAPTQSDFNALLAKLRTAGVLAAS